MSMMELEQEAMSEPKTTKRRRLDNDLNNNK